MPSLTRAWARRNVPADAELASITRQGAWVLAGLIGVSVLGFGFWALAVRLFPPPDPAVGIAASLVSLSTFGAALAMMGFDAGLLRFAPREAHPRKLIRTILVVTGLLAGGFGLLLPWIMLTINGVDSGLLWPLMGVSLLLTVGLAWMYVTNGALLAARQARIASSQILLYGVVKIGLLFAFVFAGVLGLFAAYTLPLLALVVIWFLLIPRYWPAVNLEGTPHSLREVATLSAGNWISHLGIGLPNLTGPALVLTFFDASTTTYFFLAFQLAEILNYGAEALSKSLMTHASRDDRLSHTLAARVRTRVFLVLVPLVVAGIVGAPTIGLLIGGPGLAERAPFLQLFLLATLPRSSYQILLARLNVDRRPLAVAVCGATYGALTFGGFFAELLLGVNESFLPVAWILGGIGASVVALHFARRPPPLLRPSPSPP